MKKQRQYRERKNTINITLRLKKKGNCVHFLNDSNFLKISGCPLTREIENMENNKDIMEVTNMIGKKKILPEG